MHLPGSHTRPRHGKKQGQLLPVAGKACGRRQVQVVFNGKEPRSRHHFAVQDGEIGRDPCLVAIFKGFVGIIAETRGLQAPRKIKK
jgi:hypothetical protein